MTAPLVLAIDLGTQSMRVTALDARGERRFGWQRPVATRIAGPCQEQDSAEWAALLHEGLAAAAEAGIVPAAIVACGPLAGFVPLDETGAALGPAVMYNDAQAKPDLAPVEAAIAGDGTALRPVVADPLPQALRLRRAAPEIFARTAHLLDATGWLNHALTGRATLNPVTGLRLYGPEVAKGLGIDPALFGRIAPVGEIIAPIAPALATTLGWPPVPVVSAPFDSKTAYIASGIGTRGDALDISGTVTSFGVFDSGPLHDPQRRVYALPFGAGWLVRGSTAAAGSVLEWARALLGIDFDTLDALAASAPPGAGGLVLVPYHAGARAPLWDPEARGRLAGLSLETDRAALARAAYEGLAMSLRHILETIEELGVPVGRIRLTGGLSRSAVLSQIKADVLGRPLVALAESELTTIGLAVIGSVAIGVHPDHAAASAAMVREGDRFLPGAGDAYDAAYARYLQEAAPRSAAPGGGGAAQVPPPRIAWSA